MERTVGTIVLRPTVNRKGRYYFYSIITGRRINCRCWTELHIPNKSVRRIDKISYRCDCGYDFSYRDSTDTLDDYDSDDNTYDPSYN